MLVLIKVYWIQPLICWWECLSYKCIRFSRIVRQQNCKKLLIMVINCSRTKNLSWLKSWIKKSWHLDWIKKWAKPRPSQYLREKKKTFLDFTTFKTSSFQISPKNWTWQRPRTRSCQMLQIQITHLDTMSTTPRIHLEWQTNHQDQKWKRTLNKKWRKTSN